MLGFLNRILNLLFPRPASLAEIEILSAEQARSRFRPPERMHLPALQNIPVAATAILSYRQPLIRQAVWELKYRGNPKIARLFGNLAAMEIQKISLQTAKNILLIPLPSSARRHRERGWNQTELMARRIDPKISNGFSVSTGILEKIRHTSPQATLKNRQRLVNLKDCFRLMKSADTAILADSLIILLDDVTTTGATFAEALKPFFRAGLTDIYCLAIAH